MNDPPAVVIVLTIESPPVVEIKAASAEERKRLGDWIEFPGGLAGAVLAGVAVEGTAGSVSARQWPIETAVSTFQHWLHLPDPSPLLAVLGAVAANRLGGDPVWLMLVGPPGGGKSELLASLNGLPDVHPTATLTEAALLSGTPTKERANNSKGGLLREIGDFGIVLCKDFGGVLSMNRDTRAAVLAALREEVVP